jgi:hypothetical protein
MQHRGVTCQLRSQTSSQHRVCRAAQARRRSLSLGWRRSIRACFACARCRDRCGRSLPYQRALRQRDSPPLRLTVVVRRTSCSLQLHASAAWLARRWRVGPPYVRASPKVTIGGDVGSRGEKWRGASVLKIGAHLGGRRARRRRRRRAIAPSRGVYRRRFHGKAHPTHRPNAKDRSRISAHAIELYFARHGWTWVTPTVS